MANGHRLSGDCSLIPTSYLAHAKELTAVPAREDRFPELEEEEGEEESSSRVGAFESVRRTTPARVSV